MMRKTDVSRLLPDPNQESAKTGAQPSRCAAAVERATALLIHGMQQSDTPISELGGALARMARTLGEVGTPLFGATSEATPGVNVEVLCDSLARDIAVCIQSLQFHDRLMQQLTQARDLLAGHVADGLLAHAPGPPANEGNIEGSVELF
jgi:hypothetical protein